MALYDPDEGGNRIDILLGHRVLHRYTAILKKFISKQEPAVNEVELTALISATDEIWRHEKKNGIIDILANTLYISRLEQQRIKTIHLINAKLSAGLAVFSAMQKEIEEAQSRLWMACDQSSLCIPDMLRTLDSVQQRLPSIDRHFDSIRRTAESLTKPGAEPAELAELAAAEPAMAEPAMAELAEPAAAGVDDAISIDAVIESGAAAASVAAAAFVEVDEIAQW